MKFPNFCLRDVKCHYKWTLNWRTRTAVVSAICQKGFRNDLWDDKLVNLISLSVRVVCMCMSKYNLVGKSHVASGVLWCFQ